MKQLASSSQQGNREPRSPAQASRIRQGISFLLRWLTWMLPLVLLVSWLLSYKCSQDVTFALGRGAVEMSCWRGRILLQVSHDPEAMLGWGSQFSATSSSNILAPMDYAEDCTWHRSGFGLDYTTDSSNYVSPSRLVSFWRIVVPCWFVLFAFLVVSAWSVVRWKRRRRKRLAGGCRRCGYNLTGNVSGVCPECGEKI